MHNVAVVTPVFNTQDFLHQCIGSVLSQSGVSIQFILVDDGSTDNSPSILRHYSERDERIKLITKENEGQGIARNVGIRIADAEYIYFVDSDDYLGDGALKTLYQQAKDASLDICSPGVPGHYFEKPLEHIACLPCKSQFIRLSIIKEHNILQPSVSSGQDGVFSHLVLTHCERIGMTSDAQYHYTHARPGSTFSMHLKRHDLIPSIIDEHYSAIEQHYDAHALWERNALRLLNFVSDETLRNRVAPHYDHLNESQKREIFLRLQGVTRRAFAKLSNSQKRTIPPIVNQLLELDTTGPHFTFDPNDSNTAAKVHYPKNENFSRGNLTVCKYSDPMYEVSTGNSRTTAVSQAGSENLSPSKDPAPAPHASQSYDTKEILSKLDFIVNTINNSTVQLKSAIRNGPSGLRSGESELIASVTTLASRLPLVHLAIESIFAQTIKPSQIVLWLSDEISSNAVETPELRSLQDRGLQIRFVKDVGPHTKLIYALQEFGDQCIVTFDDDIMYPINMIQALWLQHKSFPKAIIGNWARELAFDEFGKVLGVRSGRLLTPANLDTDIEQAVRYSPAPTMIGFPYGTSGVLYPPGSLNSRVFEVETFRDLCPKEDDIWFRAMGIMQGTPVVPTNLGINPKHHCITGSQYEALRHDNHGQQQNLIQMQRVFEALDLYKYL